MPISDKEVFVQLLSDARKNSSQNAKVYRQFGEAAENSKLKRVLEKLAFITENDAETVDHCFEKIGEKPVQPPFRLEDVLAPDFKMNLAQLAPKKWRVLGKRQPLRRSEIYTRCCTGLMQNFSQS